MNKAPLMSISFLLAITITSYGMDNDSKSPMVYSPLYRHQFNQLFLSKCVKHASLNKCKKALALYDPKKDQPSSNYTHCNALSEFIWEKGNKRMRDELKFVSYGISRVEQEGLQSGRSIDDIMNLLEPAYEHQAQLRSGNRDDLLHDVNLILLNCKSVEN